MDKLKEILLDLHPGFDFDNCTTLIDDQILDSLDIVTLINEISDAYDIEIPPQEIVPENFNSMQSLKAMIEKLS